MANGAGVLIYTCVVSVPVASKSGARNDVEQFGRIQQEQQRPQHGALRLAAQQQ